jgi:hypothetical protein
VIDALFWILVGLALLATLAAVVLAVLDRRVNWPVLGVLAMLEVGLLIQLVVGIVQLAGTDRDVAGVTFVVYLVGSLLVLPVGALWALTDSSRWGAGALAVACLVIPVMEMRLDQIWSGA